MSLDFNRLEQILAEASAKADAAQRAAFLDEECGQDRELRAEVDRLLAAGQQAGDFLETPVQLVAGVAGEENDAAAEDSVGAIEGAGSIIGRYKLLEEIGEGAFGVVFMAEQLEPVQRQVALKIIKAGMDTREVIARFEAERQALALMDHPNIAHVFDGGVTQAGRPYFAMELVRGIAITEFCDQRNLATPERLQLFIQACHAVQHAHQKGIIHRDLKPSNILVTLIDGQPVPKVIDFGVAKALGRKLTDKTLFTGFLRMIGTPAYMSPEQADLSGVDIDTRSDIYALGVLLYELLTGVTPFDTETLRNAALDEIRRLIRETEPPPPSTRISRLEQAKRTTVAKHRQTEPAALSRLVRGDLDWIVMKCLEKDRGRRYETVNSLADDIERHLKLEPVVAAAPGALYRAGKFVRRHRFGVAMAATLTLALTAGLVAALLGFAQAKREREHAERLAREEARQREIAEANYLTAREAVDQMLTRLAADLAGQPHMSQIRRQLLEDALRFYQGFLQQKGNDPELRHAVAQTYMRVGLIYHDLGQYDKSLEPLGKALALLEDLAQRNPNVAEYREEMVRTHAFTAGANMSLERTAQSVAHRQSAVALCEELQRKHPDAPKYLTMGAYAHVDLGNAFRGRPRDKLEEKQQALRLYEERRTRFPNLPEDPVLLSHIRHWLGRSLEEMGRFEEAEQQYRQAHELRTQLVANQPGSAELKQSLAHIKWYLGDLLVQTGRPREGEKFIREAIAIMEKNLEDDPDFLEWWRRLGYVYEGLSRALLAMQRTPEAEAALRHSVELHTKLARAAPGEPAYPNAAANSLYELGVLLQGSGRSEEAAEVFQDSIGTYEKLVGENPELSASQYHLGWILATCPMVQLRDPPRAVALARHAVQLSPELPICWTVLGAAQYRLGDPAAAIEALQRATELQDGGDARQWFFLAMADWQKGDREQARVWYDKAILWIEKYHPANETLDRLRAEAEALLAKAKAN